MREEGWYVDPFGAHEQRWFSNGMPTALVRDGDATATDVPPSPTWDRPVTPLEPVLENDGADLLRADAAAPPAPRLVPEIATDESVRDRPWWDPKSRLSTPSTLLSLLGTAVIAVLAWWSTRH